jgi:hypothetical protein
MPGVEERRSVFPYTRSDVNRNPAVSLKRMHFHAQDEDSRSYAEAGVVVPTSAGDRIYPAVSLNLLAEAVRPV